MAVGDEMGGMAHSKMVVADVGISSLCAAFQTLSRSYPCYYGGIRLLGRRLISPIFISLCRALTVLC